MAWKEIVEGLGSFEGKDSGRVNTLAGAFHTGVLSDYFPRESKEIARYFKLIDLHNKFYAAVLGRSKQRALFVIGELEKLLEQQKGVSHESSYHARNDQKGRS